MIFDFRFAISDLGLRRMVSLGGFQSKIENRKSKIPCGFTLLEVMVALAIIAIALVSIVVIRNNCIKEVDHARQFQIARMLAEERLAEIETAENLLMVPLSGDFYDHEGFTWRAEISEERYESPSEEPADVPLTYFKVSLHVFDSSSKDALVSLATFVRPREGAGEPTPEEEESPWDREEGEGQGEGE